MRFRDIGHLKSGGVPIWLSSQCGLEVSSRIFRNFILKSDLLIRRNLSVLSRVRKNGLLLVAECAYLQVPSKGCDSGDRHAAACDKPAVRLSRIGPTV